MKSRGGSSDIKWGTQGTIQNMIWKIMGTFFKGSISVFFRGAIEVEDLPEHSKNKMQPSNFTDTLLKCLFQFVLSNKHEEKC